jgi:surface polysaccharide O-acyltransferase-like enzyme
VWSVIYALFQAYFFDHHLPRITGSDQHPTDVGKVIKSFFAQPLFYHLWFVYILVGIYLIVPLLRPLTALPPERRAQLLRYALVLWVIFSPGVQLLHELWPHEITLYTPAFPTIPVSFVGLVLLGFYLHHHDAPIRNPGLLLFGCAAAVVVGALVYFYDLTHARPTGFGLNDQSPQIALYSACVFLFGKVAYDRPGRGYPFVALFSRLSYRIYLMHALVLHYLRAISPMKHWYLNQPVLSIPTMMVLTLVISFALSWLLDQIKPIRNYI